MTDRVGAASYELSADLTPLRRDMSDADRLVRKTGAATESAFGKQAAGGINKASSASGGLMAKWNNMASKGGITGALLGGVGLGAGLGAFTAVSAGISAVSDTITGAVAAAAEFQDQLATINTVAQMSDEALSALGESIQQMSVESGKSTTDLTGAFYDLVSAGVDAGHAMGVLQDATTLATGALSTTGEAVDLLTSTLNAYGLQADESTRLTDIFAQTVQDGKVTAAELAGSIANIAPIASAAGVAIEEVAAGYAVMTAQGVPAAEAATKMRSAIVALISPNKALNDIQEDTGINFAELMRAEGVATAIQTLSRAVNGNEAVLTNALGRVEAYQFALSVTGENADNFARAQERMTHAAKVGGIALSQATKRQDTLLFRQQQLSAEWNTLMQDLGTTLMPLAEGVVDIGGSLIGAIRGLGDAINGLADAATNLGGADLDRNLTAVSETLTDPEARQAFDEWLAFTENMTVSSQGLKTTLDNLHVAEVNQNRLFEILAGIARDTGTPIEDVINTTRNWITEMDRAGFSAADTTGRVDLFRQMISNVQDELGATNTVLEATAAVTDDQATAAEQAEAALHKWLTTTREGIAVWTTLIPTMGTVNKSIIAVGDSAQDAGEAFDRSAAKAALLRQGVTDISREGKAAAGSLKDIADASDQADKAWKNLTGTGDKNKKGVRELNKEIEQWERRFKTAVMNNNSAAAGFAANELGRLVAERDARQGVIDQVHDLRDAIKNLPPNAVIPFLTPGAQEALNRARRLSEIMSQAHFGSAAHVIRASGGPVQAGGAYVVGERRPELFIPRTSGFIRPSVPTGGGGRSTVVNLSVQGRPLRAEDPTDIVRTLSRAINMGVIEPRQDAAWTY